MDWAGDLTKLDAGGQAPIVNGRCVTFRTTSEDRQREKDCGNGQHDQGEDCDPSAGDNDCTADCKKIPKTLSCGDFVKSDGGLDDYLSPPISLGGTNGVAEGTFWFSWDTLNIPDEIKILRAGVEIFSTTPACLGTQGPQYQQISLSPGPDEIQVQVRPNCGYPIGDTRWGFVVQCIEDMGTLAHTTEPEPAP